MSLTKKVLDAIAAQQAGTTALGAVADAERLADQYADVKPTPYVVPIERFVGMAIELNLERPVLHALR